MPTKTSRNPSTYSTMRTVFRLHGHTCTITWHGSHIEDLKAVANICTSLSRQPWPEPDYQALEDTVSGLRIRIA